LNRVVEEFAYGKTANGPPHPAAISGGFERVGDETWRLTDMTVRLDLGILFRNIRRQITLD